MKIHLHQLYSMNRTKPNVEVVGIDGKLQWDYCDLNGLPPEVEGKTMNSMGKIPKGQWDNLPEIFTATDGKEYKINDIHTLMSKRY